VSTSPISTSLFSQVAASPSAANQFATDLNQLAKDLQSGNLAAAQQDFVTLSQDALNGVTSATANTSASGITTNLLSDIASSQSNSNSFVNELNSLGTDLQSGNLTAAQQDLLSLDSTALGAASPTTTVSASTSSTSSTSPSDVQALIKAIVQAIGSGDTSAASSDLAQLASVSGSSEGASYLNSLSTSLASGSSTSSISQLLQSLNTSGSNSSSSILNELA
jgi:trimeric autotransporter adhesin